MGAPAIYFRLAPGSAAFIAPAVSDDITVWSERLIDWNGFDEYCTPQGISRDDVRDASDSAMEIAYVSSGDLHGLDMQQGHSSVGPGRIQRIKVL
jgi:hypothetical protein